MHEADVGPLQGWEGTGGRDLEHRTGGRPLAAEPELH